MKRLYLFLIVCIIIYGNTISAEALNTLNSKISEISIPSTQVKENIIERPSSYIEFSFTTDVFDNNTVSNNENRKDDVTLSVD
jgi:hypothetical protein